MFKVVRFLDLLLLLPILFFGETVSWAQYPANSASPSDACLAFKQGLSLGASLGHTKAKLRAGETLTIVALG